MMARGEGRSAGGEAARLRNRGFWGTKAEGTGEFELASPFMRIKPRANLDMPDAKIAPLCGARKWYTAYSQRKNSFYNLNDRPRLGFERSWSHVVPFGFTAAQRAIPHAKSPKAV